MKTSQNIFYTAVKATFVLFGIVPLIGLMIFGDLPSFSIMQSEVSWLEADITLLIRPLNSFKRHILRTDLGSKKQRALDYSAASTYDHRQRHVISPWYAPELSNR